MADFWLPTASELRRQCNVKLAETEKEFWMTTSEMLHGMLENIWDTAKKGEPVTITRGSHKLTIATTPHVPSGDA